MTHKSKAELAGRLLARCDDMLCVGLPDVAGLLREAAAALTPAPGVMTEEEVLALPDAGGNDEFAFAYLRPAEQPDDLIREMKEKHGATIERANKLQAEADDLRAEVERLKKEVEYWKIETKGETAKVEFRDKIIERREARVKALEESIRYIAHALLDKPGGE